MSNLRLYISPGACSLAPHILLREAGVKFSVTVLNVWDGFPSSFLHINPKARVPVLQFDDQIITEVPAIMTAIAQLVPKKHLLGKSNLDVVRLYELFNWVSGTVHGQGYGCLLRPARFSNDESMFDGIKAKGRETIQESYKRIEEQLEGRNWAVGDDFTAIDAYLLVFYRWGNEWKFSMRDKYPNYTKLVMKVAERESVKEACKEEGIDVLNDPFSREAPSVSL